MFGQQGLSLDQAPPISVILRFFLAGALWGVIAGAILLLEGPKALDPGSNAALIETHALTLGVMLSFMFGALFQMLPVLAGVSFRRPRTLAIRTQYPLSLGTILLLSYFGGNEPVLAMLAAFFLFLGIVPVGAAMLYRLARTSGHSASSRGMLYALVSLGILFVLGLDLLGARSGLVEATNYLALKKAHMAYGVLGWITLLILSVSFQVIEMFYVTPPYPKLLSRWLPPLVSLVLLLLLAAAGVAPAWQALPLALIALSLLLYALFTLRRLSQRRRPLADATVWFWRLGMTMLALSVSLLLLQIAGASSPAIERLTAVFFTFFATSVVLAMSYKIVPFLTWFHLNAQGYFSAPMMHEIVRPSYAMMNLRIHLSALLALAAGVWLPRLLPLGGALFALSFFWLALAIYRAWHRYEEVRAEGGRIDVASVRTP